MAIAYSNGVVSVGTTAVTITVKATNGGILLQNLGTVAVFVGGLGVTADATATGGIQIPANGVQLIPNYGDGVRTLYLISTAAGNNVAWIQA